MTPTDAIQVERLCSHCGGVVNVNRYGCFGLHFATEPSGHYQLCPASGRRPEEVRSSHTDRGAVDQPVDPCWPSGGVDAPGTVQAAGPAGK